LPKDTKCQCVTYFALQRYIKWKNGLVIAILEHIGYSLKSREEARLTAMPLTQSQNLKNLYPV